MAKRKKEQEKGGGSWLTSYADLVTVLFALFVMLYAMSDIDEERWAEFARAAARGTPTAAAIFDFAGEGINDLVGSGILDLPFFDMAIFEFTPPGEGQFDAQIDQMEVVADILQTYFGEAGLAGTIGIYHDQRAGIIVITTYGDVYFDSGQATIRPETFPILDIIGSAIATLADALPAAHVSIEGHTDSVPIHTAQFQDNWALSTARATNILRYFVYTIGVIEPYRIQAVGHGEYRPVATNLTPEGRQANRRVVIRIFEGDPGVDEADVATYIIGEYGGDSDSDSDEDYNGNGNDNGNGDDNGNGNDD